MHYKFYVLKLRFIIIICTLFIMFFISILMFYSFCVEKYDNYIFSCVQSIPVPIIMYHSILKDTSKSNKYTITPSTLEKDINYVLDNGYTPVFVSDLINYVYYGSNLPEKPIILSFDDGEYNNYAYLFPLLKKYNIKATISIVGIYTDNYTKSDEANPNYGYLRWKDVDEMINSGLVEFGNHSYNLHRNYNGRNGSKKKIRESLEQYQSFLVSDLSKLQDSFKFNVNYTPLLYAYPYGAISKESLDIIKNIGFKASFSCTAGINYITNNENCLYKLKRNNRPAGISTESFFNKILKK